MTQNTLSIIKPDAVERNLTGKINAMFESNGLKIVAQKMIHLSREDAAKFYEIHSARPFFNDLVNYMCSSPVVVQVLQGQDAVAQNRKIMGATNPSEAEQGTIRAEFAESIDRNSVHGSDSPENAANEIAFFFSQREIVA